MKQLALLGVLAVSLVAISTVSARSQASLNDFRIGRSQTALTAQITHSREVLAFFAARPWMTAPRHRSCSGVAWVRLCRHARDRVAAHRWLLSRAERLSARLYPAAPSGSDMGAWECLHSHEGSWTDTSGTYQGGLQMDATFAAEYGADFQRAYGASPGLWPVADQIEAARRARDGYGGYGARGYGPWPQTRYDCGL